VSLFLRSTSKNLRSKISHFSSISKIPRMVFRSIVRRIARFIDAWYIENERFKNKLEFLKKNYVWKINKYKFVIVRVIIIKGCKWYNSDHLVRRKKISMLTLIFDIISNIRPEKRPGVRAGSAHTSSKRSRAPNSDDLSVE